MTLDGVAVGEERIAYCAVKWWESRRPLGWTPAQHGRTPDVNCPGDAEKRLARAVAAYLGFAESERA